MRSAVIGSLVLTGLLVALLIGSITRPAAMAQRPENAVRSPLPATAGLIAIGGNAAEGPQQITLIDPQTRVMSVYHVDRVSGEISLRSVRNVRWDLMMDEFNGANPSPREIRTLIAR
jgi:hypothetical protein